MAGARSTAEAEEVTEQLTPGMRRRLGISRRVPDTTLRQMLCGLSAREMRTLVQRSVQVADRRKALGHEGLPFGVAAMDGKSVTLPNWDAPFVQRHAREDGQAIGLLRTVTSSLVSSSGAPCLDAYPVPGNTNETGVFQEAFAELVAAHGSRFRLITYDAGAASAANAAAVVAAKKDYLFALKQDQPLKHRTAQTLLDRTVELARTEDVVDNRRTVVRSLRLAKISKVLHDAKEPIFWPSTTTVAEVTAQMMVDGQMVSQERRLYLCSLAVDVLAPGQWLHVVRRHWGVENDCHKTFDVAFGEDDHPWIEMNPQGALVVLLLRRLAYNLLTLFRSVTQRSSERRGIPWKSLMAWVRWTLLAASEDHLDDLRIRRIAVAFA
jgi:predicted transposase YbfD/YdcC